MPIVVQQPAQPVSQAPAGNRGTAQDIVSDALKRINAYAPGEPIGFADQNDGLVLLNDLLDSLSNEHLACFNRVENIFDLTSGQNIYTVGNPVGGALLGTTSANSNVISGVTPVPAGVVLGSGLSGPGIPSGATVTAIGASTITMSAPATATYGIYVTITFTTPGQINIQRPLRVLQGFTRLTTSGISQVDYPMTMISVEQWAGIGLKNQPGPWPKVLYYDATMPLATMYFWPNPSQGGEVHLWTDNLFTDLLTLNTPVTLPQGYLRFLKIALAREIWTTYRAMQPFPPLLQDLYREAKNAVKNLNAQNQAVAEYDRAIAGRSRNDAGWILHGGF